MILEKDGFKYPHIDNKKCIECGICKKVCPVLNQKIEEKELPDTYACINKNEKIRMESSSGGVFSLFAEYVLNKNGIIYGAAFNDKLEVQHIKVEKNEDLKYLRGSKYLQSDIGETFKEAKKLLDEGKVVFFTGTPCQIEGLKSFLRKDYINLICGDLICHGVPSKNIFDVIIVVEIYVYCLLKTYSFLFAFVSHINSSLLLIKLLFVPCPLFLFTVIRKTAY